MFDVRYKNYLSEYFNLKNKDASQPQAYQKAYAFESEEDQHRFIRQKTWKIIDLLQVFLSASSGFTLPQSTDNSKSQFTKNCCS